MHFSWQQAPLIDHLTAVEQPHRALSFNTATPLPQSDRYGKLLPGIRLRWHRDFWLGPAELVHPALPTAANAGAMLLSRR
jgi:hypothetical protein